MSLWGFFITNEYKRFIFTFHAKPLEDGQNLTVEIVHLLRVPSRDRQFGLSTVLLYLILLFAIYGPLCAAILSLFSLFSFKKVH